METSRYKKTFFVVNVVLIVLALGGVKAVAADNEQRSPSTITNVTVFLNQAQVTRIAKVNLQAGVTSIIFDRVSPYINLNSIQVKTESNLTLLSVSQRNNFLSNNDKPAFVTTLEDTLNATKHQLALLRVKKEALQLEKEVIVANKHIGGENTGVKIEDLEDALVLFRKRYQEIGEDMLKLEASEKKLAQIEQKIQAQLDQYINGQNNVEIVVTVKALQAINNSKIEWSYLVGNTSWSPFYDIRVKDTKSPLQLVSKAYITQATGEDWKNVILKLSTTNPNEGGTKPELTTSYLSFSDQTGSGDGNRSGPPSINIRGARAESSAYFIDGKAQDKQLNYSTGIATPEQAAVNIEFNVTSAYTIPSDNTPHQVDLSVNSLPAEYAYGSVPKLDKDAFVTARVSGNDLVNQISGEASVYYDGTFTGRTFINGTTSDSLLLSLGRDKRIQIQRTLLKDFSSKSFTGGNKKELNTWEISVRNTRKEPITLIIEDQIPVSTDKDIEVKLLQQGNAQFDETTGKLIWKITLDGEKSTSLRFSFEVKYPKEKIISGY